MGTLWLLPPAGSCTARERRWQKVAVTFFGGTGGAAIAQGFCGSAWSPQVPSMASALAFVGHDGEGAGMSDCKEQRDKEPSPLENGLEMRGARSLSALHDGVDALEVTLSLMLLGKHPSQMCP